MVAISDCGLIFIEGFEGCKLEAYQDIVGIWTIGIGHTGTVDGVLVGPGMTITQDQAMALLRSDCASAEKAITDQVTVSLTQNQVDALVSFVFNVGVGNFESSTLLRKLNASDYEGAAGQFLVWDHAGGQISSGLLRRRQAEHDLFLTADSVPAVS